MRQQAKGRVMRPSCLGDESTLVESGLCGSASEVVREALRLMDEHDRVRAAMLEPLRAEVRRGLDIGRSQAWDASQTKRQARARRTTKTTKA